MSDVNQKLRDIIDGKLKGKAAADTLYKVDSSALRKFVTDNNLSGEQISKLTPQGYGADKLTLKQNLSAMKAQGRGLFSEGALKAPKKMFQAGLKGLSETGGGYRAGTGHMGRYLPMGGKATALTATLPGISDALKKEDPTGQGRSQTERVSASLGEVAGNVLTSVPNSVINRLGVLALPVAFAGGMAGGYVGKKVGGAVGKTLDKGVSALRGVESGDVTNQEQRPQKRKPGSGAI